MRSWGVKAEEGERKAAFVKCAGTCEKKANQDYEYTGVQDCAAMAFVPNGGIQNPATTDVLDLVTV